MLVSARYFQKKAMSEEAALLYQKVRKSKPYEICIGFIFRIIALNEFVHARKSLGRCFFFTSSLWYYT
jgi:hypothetical protein